MKSQPLVFVKRAIELTEAQYTALEQIAATTGSLSPVGTTKGQPSWRTLVKRIANGELTVLDQPTDLRSETEKLYQDGK